MDKNKARDMQQHKGNLGMNTPPIVAPAAWEAAHRQMLVKEKALTRARDALAAERRRMPWMAVAKAYEFEGPKGKVSLLDLFEGRRQLIVYRAFFEPGVFGWPEHACRGCSLGADQVAHLAHLNARDTTLVYASRAPQADIARLKARMGWEMPWYTITAIMHNEPPAPKIVDRSTFQAELDALRVREKAHTREGDAIAAARRRLPMVEVDGAIPLIGEQGTVALLDAFEGRRMLIAYYFMWHAGRPAPEQCEDSPDGWPKWSKDKHSYRIDGRPITQWPRLKAGHSDDLGTGKH